MTKTTTTVKGTAKAELRGKRRPRTEYLFVQSARDVELVAKRRGGKTFTLTLRGLEPTVIFSDRPVRLTGHETTRRFVANWEKGPNSFADDPPNAELVIFNSGKAPSAVTLKLRDPQWQPEAPNKLSYTATSVDKGEPLISVVGGAAALFIDGGGEQLKSGDEVPWAGNWEYSVGRRKVGPLPFEEGDTFPEEPGRGNWNYIRS